MLDSVVNLIEKITELLKYRADRRARNFERFIEPMYVTLKKVHQDYLYVFETAKTELASDRSLSAIADSLEFRRRAEEAERRAILQQAKVLRTSESLVDCQSFFEATEDYFRETPLSGGSTPSNMLLQAIRDASSEQCAIQSNKPLGSDPRVRLSSAIELTLSMLRRSWERVSSEYAKALASSVG